MSRDADKKRILFNAWSATLLPKHSFHLCEPFAPLDPNTLMARLAGLPVTSSIYILFANIGGEATPVYIGKADDPSVRWRQHIDGWIRGTRSYARWRKNLIDTDDRVRYDVTLLVVPAEAIVNPPLPGFPTTVGSVEYQLVGLASDAFPGRLLNCEGKER